VNTKKTLAISPMFYLSLFFEGEASSSVLSHYFNITSSTTSASTASASLIPASSGLSAGAKAGIAIGVAGAMLLGVLASWLILGRRAKTNNVQTNYYEPAKVDYRLQQHRQEVNPSRQFVHRRLMPSRWRGTNCRQWGGRSINIEMVCVMEFWFAWAHAIFCL